MIKNYLFSAIDFSIDGEGHPYFIEANSSPGYLKRYKEINNSSLIKKLSKKISKKNNLAITSSKDLKSSFTYKEFKHHFRGNVYLCNTKKNNKILSSGKGHLITTKKELILPDIVFRRSGRTIAQQKNHIKVINPTKILNITLDNVESRRAVQKFAKIRLPKGFIIKNKKDIKKKLHTHKELFKEGFILRKKRSDTHDFYLFKNFKDIKMRIKEEYILEQPIYGFKEFKKKFFIVRGYTIYGKFKGSIIFRIKKKKNFFTFSKSTKTPNFIERKIKNLTEEITNAIDEYSRKPNVLMSYKNFLKQKNTKEKILKKGPIAILAYHAGTEYATGKIAKNIKYCSIYLAKNPRYRVASTKITPTHSEKLTEIIKLAKTAVSIHGHSKNGYYYKDHKKHNRSKTIYITGKNRDLAKKIIKRLKISFALHYYIEYDLKHIPKHLRGISEYNIINSFEKKGVQIELPLRLRANKHHRIIFEKALSSVIEKESGKYKKDKYKKEHNK